MFIELVESVALLLSLALIYGFIARRWAPGTPTFKLLSGCLFGIICIIGMQIPVVVEPGVIFDARTVVLSMASVFGGATVGLLAGALAGTFRAWIGGGGAAVGVSVCVMAVLLGLVYRYLAQSGRIRINAVTLLVLGVVVHVVEVGLFALLPADVVDKVMSGVSFPLIVAFAPATAFLGLIFQAIENEVVVRQQLAQARRDKSTALEKVIHVLSAALETRDPYTAGHEENVADFVVKIGRKLGFDEHKLEGLHLAATVHDVGKIQVPTDILAKPTKLTPQEYELVKMHPAVGAKLLAGIDFDWPIAEMIEQHHERCDGSGYPHGLRADEILLEAKIIAVADTLDAMASHRPYRAALGVEAAIEELEAGRGTKFDPEVVDACVQLIRAQEITV